MLKALESEQSLSIVSACCHLEDHHLIEFPRRSSKRDLPVFSQ